MAHQDITRQPPIGFWLKHLDEVITRRVNQVLGDNDFTRYEWQVINTIYEVGAIARTEVLNTLKNFVNTIQLDEIINRFTKEGWLVAVDGKDDQLELTQAGKNQRESLFKLQSEVRRRLMQGITDQEYSTVIEVLRRMAINLES